MADNGKEIAEFTFVLDLVYFRYLSIYLQYYVDRETESMQISTEM